ncbi:hypothetical protein [Microbulbifer variabilis]|uniref:hypothetical protein n=1 Tax=Microbulbifer variabilis TaxID=266805 RepID=UPI001CFD7902|nr:hypothetical protein [Microbulbifer variabilis]
MVQKIASATTTATAGTAVVSGYSVHEVLALGGFLVFLGGSILGGATVALPHWG